MGMEQRRSSRDTCGKGVIMIRVNQLKLPIEHSEEMKTDYQNTSSKK